MKRSCVCQKCGTEFFRYPSERGIYCSSVCTEGMNRKHGLSISSEYSTWRTMKARCFRVTHQDYPRYGARGITVCDRWKNSFQNFYADMGPKPDIKLTIERLESSGNYEPGNCVWATRTEQSRNRGSYTYNSEEDQKIREAVALGYNFTQMAEYVGLPRGSVTARAYRLGLGSGQRPTPKKTADSRSASPLHHRGAP